MCWSSESRFRLWSIEGEYDLERSVGYTSGYHVLDHLPRGAEEAAGCPGKPRPHHPRMVRWGNFLGPGSSTVPILRCTNTIRLYPSANHEHQTRDHPAYEIANLLVLLIAEPNDVCVFAFSFHLICRSSFLSRRRSPRSNSAEHPLTHGRARMWAKKAEKKQDDGAPEFAPSTAQPAFCGSIARGFEGHFAVHRYRRLNCTMLALHVHTKLRYEKQKIHTCTMHRCTRSLSAQIFS